jgi:hypothetical protein
VAIQAAFGAEWIGLKESQSTLLKGANRCVPTDSHHSELAISCVYPMCLMLLTTIMAAVNWKNDENNYECRSIMIAMIHNVVLWVVWVVLVVKQDLEQRDAIITVANLCCGCAVLFAVFGRKLYMLHLFKKAEDANPQGSSIGKGINRSPPSALND